MNLARTELKGRHKQMKNHQPATLEDTFLQHVLPGTSPQTLKLREEVKIINNPANRDHVRVVLLRGETGVGKNHLARVITAHERFLQLPEDEQKDILAEWSIHARNYMQEVLLPGIPDGMVAAELFGARRGAYTGLTQDRVGAFGGEGLFVLLDEIGDCPMEVQTKLLHVLDTRMFRPLNSPDDEETQKRILLATNRDVRELVRTGKFRQDFLWRIDMQLTLPSLHEEPLRIAPLIQTMWRQKVAAYDNALADLKEPSAADLKWATGYRWPGNIRQLDRALSQFLLRRGAISLRELALQQERDFAAGDASATLDGDLRLGRPIGSPDAAQRRGEAAARREVISWYDQHEPSDAILRRVFPDVKPQSVRVKMSQWRAELSRT